MRNPIEKRVRLAHDGFMTHTVDRVASGLQPHFGCSLLPEPVLVHTQWDHGDTTSRALLAWLRVREMLGDFGLDPSIEQGLREHLRAITHPLSGLVCVPEHSDPANDQYYYHMWDQGRTLAYLGALLQVPDLEPSRREETIQRMRLMQESLLRLARRENLSDESEAIWWPSDLFWNESMDIPEGRDFGSQNWSGWCIVSAQLLSPQAALAGVTDDARDIEPAMGMARGFLAGFEHRRGSQSPMFGPNGEFQGHFHTVSSGLGGLVRLSRLLWARGERTVAGEWIETALRAYRWIFDQRTNPNPGSSCGCFPETSRPTPNACSELCGTADMIELAAELAQCADLDPGWAALSDLWDDVERFTRNEIFKMQFTSVERIAPHLRASTPGQEQNDRALLQRLIGIWSGSRSFLHDAGAYPGHDGIEVNLPGHEIGSSGSAPHLGAGGCCAYSGIRALYVPWKHAVASTSHGIEVRIPTDYADTSIRLEDLGGEGLAFVALADCHVRLRLPARIDLASVKVTGNSPIEWQTIERWISLSLSGGNIGKVTWAPDCWSVSEVFGLPNLQALLPELACKERLVCTLHYRGNELQSIEPQGIKIPYIDGL